MDLSKSYEFFQPEKDGARINIIGCGSVGSTIAVLLARAGVTKITLWDFDKVESKNLANQMFRLADVGRSKVEAVRDIMAEINPDIITDIKLMGKGWSGQQLSGYVFLCVDNIEIRKQIVERFYDSPFIKAMFDVRTRLKDAQSYAADWSDAKMKKDFLASMNFSHEEAAEETPVSACNVTLSVAPTVWVICSLCVSNFMNFWNGEPLRKLIVADAFNFSMVAF